MPKRDGQRGQSLLQLMIVVAIMGIMGILVARLSGKVTMGWLNQQLLSRLDFSGQATRRLLLSQMRDASAATVIITRHGVDQPVASKVCWIDSTNSSRTVYQIGDKLFAADWLSTITVTANEQTVIKEGLKSFVVYYPNAKDPSKIGFSLVLSKQVIAETVTSSAKYKAPLVTLVNAELELKNP